MKIFLTFDYELFFGSQSGSVEKCMLEPTNDLLQIARDKQVSYTFFVDVGYLICAEKYSELTQEVAAVKDQIKKMILEGHDVQLHIHPHWEKAVYLNGRWEMNLQGAYRLADFNAAERKQIIRAYKSYLEELIGRSVFVFRAGGWCIQPFELLMDDFRELGLTIDSSVIPGDFLMTSDYAVDFRDAPMKDCYKFDSDVCVENEDGFFTEFPITSMRYSPLFFWRLYVLGRLSPENHKMIGDGVFLDQGGRKKRTLLTYTRNHVSTDGYFAGKLTAALNMCKNSGFETMLTIGHPKGNTKYSLVQLQKFINYNHTKHDFTSFHNYLCD